MTRASSGLESFLADIRPFFYRHRVVYVDVGAYTGEVCEKVLASRMQVGEVHLIEPNASSLAAARERVSSIFKGHSVNYYGVALGGNSGRVRLHPAKSMTKIVSIVSGEQEGAADTNTVEVECSTLDALASNFTEGRVSLLKIDVEGFEVEVLDGAKNLLRNELIDVIYIEAGMDPNGTQQTYYRSIEDKLHEYGYRLFRIYEQHNEWLQDSPVLRRVNLAFMSRKFAEQNPYRLTNELHEVSERLSSSQQRLESAEQRIAALDQAAAAATTALAAAEQRIQALSIEQATSQEALASSSETNRRLTAERDQLAAAHKNLLKERDTLTGERDSARKKRNVLSEERDALIAERSTLTAERDSLAAERATLASERDSLLADCSMLVTERNSIASSQAQLIVERDELLAQRHELQAGRESLKRKAASLTEEKDALRQQNGSLIAQRDSLITERSSLSIERDSLIVEKTALTGERNCLAAERGSLIAERDSLIAARAASDSERNSLAAQLGALLAERDSLIAEKAVVLGERDGFAAERNVLITERDTLIAEKNTVTGERNTLAAERHALIAERDTLIAEKSAITSERNTLAAERHALITERDTLIAEKNTVTGERNTLAAERHALITERDTLIAEKNTVTGERNTLAAERHALITERDTLIAEKNTVTGERNTLAAERHALITERDTLIAEKNTVTGERNTLAAEHHALMTERDASIAERTAATGERDRLAALRDGLAAEHDSLINAHHALLTTHIAFTSERDSLLGERITFMAERDTLLAEQAKLQASNDRLTSELGVLVSERSTLLAQQAELAAERDGLIVVRRDLAAECDKAAQALATSEATIAHLTQEQEAALRDNAAQASKTQKLQGNHDKLTQRCKALEQTVAALQSAAAETASTHASMAGECDSLARQITTLRRDKEQLQHAAKQLREAQSELQHALDLQRQAFAAKQGENRKLQRRLREILEAVPQLHRRELRAWGEAKNARAEAAGIRSGLAYRLGEVALEHTKDAKGWLTLPLHLKKVRDTQLIATQEVASLSATPPAIEFHAAKAGIFLPLTLKAQRVQLPSAERAYEVLIHCLSAAAKSEAVVEAVLTYPQGTSPVINMQIARLRTESPTEAYAVPLLPDNAVSFMHLAAGTAGVTLELRRIGGSFCMVKLELREPRIEAKRGDKGQARRKRSKVLENAVRREPKDDAQTAGTTLVAMPSTSVAEVKRSGELATAGAAPRAELIQAKETRKKFSVEDLEKKLWGGFSRYALPELERIKQDRKVSKADRAAAAWNLARWFFVDADHSQALANTLFAKSYSKQPRKDFFITEAQCLIALGRHQEAEALIETCINDKVSPNPDFLLLQSTVKKHLASAAGGTAEQIEEAQLQTLNEHYRLVGMAPIQKKDPKQPLVMSNLVAHAQTKQKNQTQKVSILMPAFNAEATIEWAIEGLLQQSWKNLEIIVVDDVSTDSTCDIVAAIAKRDPRVRLIRKPVNEGPYRSRNEGLKHATGDLITVHDSDDWSHPQKLEIQIQTLEANKKAVACLSYWVRVTNTLEIVGAWLPKGSLYDINLSSLMFRRSLLESIDAWDDVRVGADAEFHSRLLAIYGKEAVPRVPQEYLLSLALTRENSLTRTEATHLRSLFYGVRRSYRDSYRLWHDKLTKSGTSSTLSGKNQFPIPLGNTPQRAGKCQSYDLVVIADFVLLGGAFVSTLNYIVAACTAGKRVAVFHWRKYELAAYSQLNPRLYDACTKYGIDLLSAGDTVETEFVLFGYPAILQHRIDPMPAISTKEVIVIINQFASRLVNGDDPQYDPRVARSNLMSMFGTEGVWVPISAWVQRLMREDKRYPAPYETPWLPMIDTKTWCKSAGQWRGKDRKIPVVGRHGRDAYTKWPARIDSLRQAYGVDAAWEVRFLGGAAHAVKELGGQPKNWQIVPFDGISVYDFLADLDFFVHYPHEGYIEEFGRAVMEAMAVGVPVILPPQFKETFGEAALYAEPADVQATVARLWSSRKAYLARSAAGRQFVLKNCDVGGFSNRLATLSAFAATLRVETRVA